MAAFLFYPREAVQLAQMVCYNPLDLNITLWWASEEGWKGVLEKVRLALSVDKSDVFADLHKPLVQSGINTFVVVRWFRPTV